MSVGAARKSIPLLVGCVFNVSTNAPLQCPFADHLLSTADFDTNDGDLSGVDTDFPSPHGAANAQWLVSVYNSGVDVHQHNGVRLVRMSLSTFFAPNSPEGTMFGGRVYFDDDAERWVLCALEDNASDGQYRLHMAVSATADPTGAWRVAAWSTLVSGSPDRW